ncbi:MAG: IscS subfamily cysteine desulfurase [Candidatus Micrarchaeota archaeon]
MAESKRYYFDHSATTAADPEVVKAMMPYFSDKFGNASSLHSFGREAKEALEKSRETTAKLLGVKPSEIYFTSGGTESDNLAVKGAAYSGRGNHLITSKIEHPAVTKPMEWLSNNGFKVTFLGVDEFGILNPEKVKKAMGGFGKKTALVSVMYANNEIGTIEPISEIAQVCRKQNVLFHTDAVQAFGKVPINFSEIDMLSASSHKIYGPKGVGLLYIKDGVKIQPVTQGGGHESGIRSGTENVAGIVGFAKAIELAYKDMEKESEREKKLRDRLIKGLLAVPETFLNGHKGLRLANNVNITFGRIEGESLVLMLDQKGIAASTGSACSSHSLKPSHVIMAINEEKDLADCSLSVEEKAHGSLRLTLGKNTTEKDIDYVLSVVPEIVGQLRKMSPLKK